MNAKAVLTAVAGKVAASLKARGFERRALKFVRRAGDDGFVSLIELQPSKKSTPEQVLFAINFGVIVPSLYVGDDLTKPEYGGCHWGGRVSGNDGVELWWPVRADEDVEQLTARVMALVAQEVLPALETKKDAQRLLFLGTLLHRAGRRDEFEETKAELERKARDPFSLRALEELKKLDG